MTDSPRGAGADTGFDVNGIPVEEVLDNLAYMHRDPPKAKIHPTSNFCFDGDQVPAPRKMLIPDVMPAEGIAFIGGQSGAGKTFVAVLMSVCLASGKPFFGKRVREKVGVVWVAAEGRSMLPARIDAAKRDLGVDGPLPIAWVRTLPDFSKPQGVSNFIVELRALAEKMRSEHGVRLAVVFIDTVSASFEIEDENDNSEAAKVCRILRRIGDAVGATTAPLCHVGKNAEAGLRGASAWRANADSILTVGATIDLKTGDTSGRSLAASKDRDGRQGPIARFSLRFLELGKDEDGEDWGTMVVVPEVGAASANKPGWPEKLNVFRQALGVALLDHGREQQPLGIDGPRVRAVDVEKVRKEFYHLCPLEEGEFSGDARRMRFKRDRDLAQNKCLIGVWADDDGALIWLVHSQHDQNPDLTTPDSERTEPPL